MWLLGNVQSLNKSFRVDVLHLDYRNMETVSVWTWSFYLMWPTEGQPEIKHGSLVWIPFFSKSTHVKRSVLKLWSNESTTWILWVCGNQTRLVLQLLVLLFCFWVFLSRRIFQRQTLAQLFVGYILSIKISDSDPGWVKLLWICVQHNCLRFITIRPIWILA